MIIRSFILSSDVLPAEIEMVDGTLATTGSANVATYDAATRTINWSGSMAAGYMTYNLSTNTEDPNCKLPFSDNPAIWTSRLWV